MDHATTFLFDLAIVTAVAAVTGMAARALKQPAILGYLLAGLIVGPYIPVPLFADPHRIESLAEFGVVLVMFSVGLEFRLKRLAEILPVSGFTALIQMAVLMWAGFSLGMVMGWSEVASFCLGSTVAISSTMVVSGIFKQGNVDEDTRKHVLGVLVVQDVVAIVLMAVVTAASQGMAVEPTALALLAGKLAAVMLGMLVVGVLVVPRLVGVAAKQGGGDGLSVLAVGVAFIFAAVATWFGYSAALGAFIGGMCVAESGRGPEVEHNISSLRALFSAIFFVSIGMTVDPMLALQSLPLALGLSLLVIVAQLLSVTAGSVLSGSSLRKGVLSGLALGQIGELSFILASIAAVGGLVPDSLLPTLVTVATVTAFTTPLLLGQGNRIVTGIDRIVPDPIHHLISMYQGLLQRSSQDTDRPSLRPPIMAVVLDWVALVLLGVLRLLVGPVVEPYIGPVWTELIAVALAVPFVVGLVRSGRRLLKKLGDRAREAARSREVARALQLVAGLAVVVGVGVPTIVVMRPLFHHVWADLVVLIALVGVVIAIGRKLGKFDGEFSSGVMRIASHLAPPNAEDDAHDESEGHPPRLFDDEVLAGLTRQSFSVPKTSPAVGQTLAALNLRCRTGATILAIRKGDQSVVLPTGHDALAADDIVAVSGSLDAVERARVLLIGAA